MNRRPKLELLDKRRIEQIIDDALELLSKVGVFVENKEGLKLLDEAGAKIDKKKKRVHIKSELVQRCLKSAPKEIKVYDRVGRLALDLKGYNIHFDPGSAALWIYDLKKDKIREPVTSDLIRFAQLTDGLKYLKAQSTALIPSDVPKEIADRYRLFISLLYSSKPVVTGTFVKEGFEVMRDMLVSIRGSEDDLRREPLAIFDCCPSPPLKWSDLTCQNLIDCAKSGIPAELVSMPLTGATAPVTLTGALIQHTAENLSGIVIHQLAQKGSPIIYGGSPACFDMRTGTTPMGAIETMMIDSSYNQIGKYFGLPTHAYMGLSDSKTLDYQSGLESGIGAILAGLSGINVISGPGMLDFESCQSMEKLVIDNEICGMAYRLIEGIAFRKEPPFLELFKEEYLEKGFLTSPHTLKWFKEEVFFPSQVIDRFNLGEWLKKGKKTAVWRANELIEKIISSKSFDELSTEKKNELFKIIQSDAKKYGFDQELKKRFKSL
ncbi:MAG: trimethylamine methyltransferase family protein [candidate division Zixibacteria bacterium]|nr:trimethylamine methyltransferase family protein [candidate division Zixibacteria bacterium]